MAAKAVGNIKWINGFKTNMHWEPPSVSFVWKGLYIPSTQTDENQKQKKEIWKKIYKAGGYCHVNQ